MPIPGHTYSAQKNDFVPLYPIDATTGEISEDCIEMPAANQGGQVLTCVDKPSNLQDDDDEPYAFVRGTDGVTYALFEDGIDFIDEYVPEPAKEPVSAS